MQAATKPIPALTGDNKRNFFRKIKINHETGCHEWKAARSGGGYGQFNLRGRMVGAHRLAYFLATGTDPAGLNACHSCDNPSCCNPDHLFLGTDADNMLDKTRKGRNNCPRGEAHGSRTQPWSWQRGEARWNAKLSSADILSIRTDPRNSREIAGQYCVSRSQITAIKRGEKWRHVA